MVRRMPPWRACRLGSDRIHPNSWGGQKHDPKAVERARPTTRARRAACARTTRARGVHLTTGRLMGVTVIAVVVTEIVFGKVAMQVLLEEAIAAVSKSLPRT